MIPWMDTKNKKNMCLQVVLTIGQQAHLDVTSTKVNQPNTLKSLCLNITLINVFYNVRTLFGCMWVQTCRLFYISYFTYSASPWSSPVIPRPPPVLLPSMIPLPMIPSPTKFVVKAHDYADNWFEQSPLGGTLVPKKWTKLLKLLGFV